jgi:hypothetical protein
MRRNSSADLTKISQWTALLGLLLLSTGCLSPVQNEIPLLAGGLSAKASGPNDTKLVIFNTSNGVLYGLDGSGRINVWVNNRGVAMVKIGHYAQVIVPRGPCHVSLTHRDMAKFNSEHDFTLTGPEAFLEIRATPISNAAELLLVPPGNLEQDFTPVR